MSASGEGWRRRVEELWEAFDGFVDGPSFVAAMTALVGELPPGDPAGLFELASAYDATDQELRAVALYREALAAGLGGWPRRQAVIQLASSLRQVGEAGESLALLRAERAREADELDDAIDAFTALALTDVGREREAVALLLRALAGHLPRYRRSVEGYAAGLGG